MDFWEDLEVCDLKRSMFLIRFVKLFFHLGSGGGAAGGYANGGGSSGGGYASSGGSSGWSSGSGSSSYPYARSYDEAQDLAYSAHVQNE